MKENNPYHRYKRALLDIAAGAPDPIAIAQEAVRSRLPVKKSKPTKPSVRARVLEECPRLMELIEDDPGYDWLKNYMTSSRKRENGLVMLAAWVNAGKPGITALARQLGFKPERVRRRLFCGAFLVKRFKQHPHYQAAEELWNR